MRIVEGIYRGILTVDGIASSVRFPNGDLSGSARTKDLEWALENRSTFHFPDFALQFNAVEAGSFRLIGRNSVITLAIGKCLEAIKAELQPS